MMSVRTWLQIQSVEEKHQDTESVRSRL